MPWWSMPCHLLPEVLSRCFAPVSCTAWLNPFAAGPPPQLHALDGILLAAAVITHPPHPEHTHILIQAYLHELSTRDILVPCASLLCHADPSTCCCAQPTVGCCADLNNCYFADPAVNVLGNLATDNVTGLAEFDSKQHRKIRLYLELASGNDANGHGTHTMGTLCGSSPSSAGTYASDYRCSLVVCMVTWSSASIGIMCWNAAGGRSGLSGLACGSCLQQTKANERASPLPKTCEASASCQYPPLPDQNVSDCDLRFARLNYVRPPQGLLGRRALTILAPSGPHPAFNPENEGRPQPSF